MYETGQQVLYGIHGICRIIGVESMRFSKERARYYVLQPIDQPDARYYVPVSKPEAVAKMRPLMTREALMDLLHSDAVRENVWIAEENQRKLRYRELITSGSRLELLQMIHSLYRHKKEQQLLGRKFHQCDEGFLHDAKKILNAEFSLVFGLEPGQVGDFIVNQMQIPENQPKRH